MARARGAARDPLGADLELPAAAWTSHVRWIAPSPHDSDLLLAGIELGWADALEDGGETWADHRPGAKRDVHCLAWHPTAEGRAYETGGDGTAWSHDAGRTWWPVDAGRDRNYAWALAIDPADPDAWHASVSPGPFEAHGDGRADAQVYRWQDEGPWEPIAGPFAWMPYALLHAGGTLWSGFADGTVQADWQEVTLSAELESIVALVEI